MKLEIPNRAPATTQRTTVVTMKTHSPCPVPSISWIFIPNIEVAREIGTKMNARAVTVYIISFSSMAVAYVERYLQSMTRLLS